MSELFDPRYSKQGWVDRVDRVFDGLVGLIKRQKKGPRDYFFTIREHEGEVHIEINCDLDLNNSPNLLKRTLYALAEGSSRVSVDFKEGYRVGSHIPAVLVGFLSAHRNVELHVNGRNQDLRARIREGRIDRSNLGKLYLGEYYKLKEEVSSDSAVIPSVV